MKHLISLDSSAVWEQIVSEVKVVIASKSRASPIIEKFILMREGYQDALCHLISSSLQNEFSNSIDIYSVVEHAIRSDSEIVNNGILDISAFLERDPACKCFWEAFLCYKGFRAIQSYRIAHYYWRNGDATLARLIGSIMSDKLSMDIHPGASIRGGIFVDHGTGIVIGETAIVERDVSILHNVTLGGTGKEKGDRHPKIGRGVLLGAGAKVLGNIRIGENAKVAAGSIVLEDVPSNVTVVGIPARVVAKHIGIVPAYNMAQNIEQ
jgi:serine O-acetyltransferase